jgi:hypothetical protein
MLMAPSQSDAGDTDERIPENAEKACPARPQRLKKVEVEVKVE